MLVPYFVKAQDLSDALRFSQFNVTGTARSGGMGNAFGALGGDFTSASINPAGLGVYRAGELVLTPAFGQTEIESSYLGNMMTDSKYNFSLNNLSYVSTIKTGARSETGLINLNIGIGYNRLKDFNSAALAGANNLNSSFLDYPTDLAVYYGFNPDGNNSYQAEFYEQLAWDTDLLLYDEENDSYWHDLEEAGYGQSQRKSISRKGSVNEYSLALGMNFNHKLYIGASVGIVDVYYNEFSELYENDANNSIPYFNNMQFDTRLRQDGTGYNGKLGIIFKPINEIRLGASVHSPTFYNLHQVFYTDMYSSVTYDDGTENYSAESPYDEYDFDLETPLRATLSGAFVIAKKGLLSIDYEFVDYGSAKLRRGGNGYSFTDENEEIKEAYKSVGNLRVGGELLATSNIALRAGFELYPSAYNESAFGASQPNADADMKVYSAGLGYRSGGFFFDVAYRMTDTESYNSLYPTPPTDFYNMPAQANFKTTKNKVLFSLGFKF